MNTKKSKKPRVRPLALCLFQHKGHLFLSQGYDAHKGETFYRPMGGKIEFGEYAADTVRREIQEEIGAGLADLRYLGLLESIFTHNNQPGHELVLMFSGRFLDPTFYDLTRVVQGTDDGRVLFDAMWKPISTFQNGDSILYPAGLLDLLTECHER